MARNSPLGTSRILPWASAVIFLILCRTNISAALDLVIFFGRKMGLSLTLGARVEGVPVEDLVGGSDGWRNAGYALSIEPGLTVSKGNFSFTVTGPVALKRHADKNLTDLRVSRLLGADIGGNAAFADYLITTSFSYSF